MYECREAQGSVGYETMGNIQTQARTDENRRMPSGTNRLKPVLRLTEEILEFGGGIGVGACLSENTCSLLQRANVRGGGKKRNFTFASQRRETKEGFCEANGL